MITSWRSQLLAELNPSQARQTIIFDPDGLLRDETLLHELTQRNFILLSYEDPIDFRYRYESEVRSRWDAGEDFALLIIFNAPQEEHDRLPYDLLENSRQLVIGLATLFPTLSYPLLTTLSVNHLDELWQAAQPHRSVMQNESQTLDFILRHVFGVAVETLKKPEDLLRSLLRRHYSKQQIPNQVENWWIAELRKNLLFAEWPLEAIVSDRAAFLTFLQERWPIFLQQQSEGEGRQFEELRPGYALQMAGPKLLPFAHNDVRVYIDNLFLEGFLKPIPVEQPKAFASSWLNVGIRHDPVGDRLRRFVRLGTKLADAIPDVQAKHQEWLDFAVRWAELCRLQIQIQEHGDRFEANSWNALRSQVDTTFAAWLQERYALLHNQPPSPPVMVHHIARTMLRHMEDHPHQRLALIIMDGLSLGQWQAVRDVLLEQIPVLKLREDALFAWIPTLTPISRQAIFAGRPPYYFGETITRTEREPEQWQRFWQEAGLNRNAIGYHKRLGSTSPAEIAEWITQPQLRILGLVVDIVDNIMHGMQLGMTGMYNQVQQWAKSGYLAALVQLLQQHGYHIWLSADHGNLEAVGNGSLSEGVIAESRGARARIYRTPQVRSQFKVQRPDTIEWSPIGLPADCYPLLASHQNAFAPSGERLMVHGGASIEEVIVPLVEISSH